MSDTSSNKVRVVFKGDADIRELSSADLQVSGVEGFSKRAFYRNVPTEVDENVAAALVDAPIYGDFEYFKPEEEEVAAEAVVPASKKKAGAGTGSDSTSTGTGSTTTGGNGSSTS